MPTARVLSEDHRGTWLREEQVTARAPRHAGPFVFRAAELAEVVVSRSLSLIIDMKQRVIHVTGTKTGRNRAIPVNDPLLEALRHLPRHLGTDYVFWNHETETRYVSIKRVWTAALKKANITGFRFHDLRHTFASHVQMGLGDLRATQTLLGHADPRMTMRYAHLSDARLREAVRSLAHLSTGATQSAISALGTQK